MIRDREIKELVVKRTENPCVGSSILSRATTKSSNIKTYDNHKKLNKSNFTTTINYNLSRSEFFYLDKLQKQLQLGV